MQPMTPEEKERLYKDRPATAPADVEEYERLLSERFMIPPPIPGTEIRDHESVNTRIVLEARIRELHERIYGPEPEPLNEK